MAHGILPVWLIGAAQRAPVAVQQRHRIAALSPRAKEPHPSVNGNLSFLSVISLATWNLESDSRQIAACMPDARMPNAQRTLYLSADDRSPPKP